MKLYHYVHCPFCVRVRMALGILNLNYDSIVLPYDDEKTPIDLMGVKMLPIFEFENGDVSNESLDIIKRLDKLNVLRSDLLTPEKLTSVNDLLSEIGSSVHSLCMPYWMWTPEFNENSRSYFQKKKEVKRGPFFKLIQNKNEFLSKLDTTLSKFENELSDFYQSNEFTIIDIMIASHLWGMYIFPEFQFSEKVNSYLQRVAKKTNFSYHEDFWRS